MRSKLLIALALVLAASFSGVAVAGIDGSLHDLTDDYPTGTGNACEYCHAPHDPDPGDQPLWNHTVTTETFTMYGTTLAGTAQATAPNGASLRCLSCHDGVTNIDAYGGGAGTENLATAFADTTANIGTTLSNDHPISIGITALPSAGQTQTTLPFYSSNIECSSCHDPHDDTTNTETAGPNTREGTSGFFLRMTNDATLCGTCHTDK